MGGGLPLQSEKGNYRRYKKLQHSSISVSFEKRKVVGSASLNLYFVLQTYMSSQYTTTLGHPKTPGLEFFSFRL